MQSRGTLAGESELFAQRGPISYHMNEIPVIQLCWTFLKNTHTWDLRGPQQQAWRRGGKRLPWFPRLRKLGRSLLSLCAPAAWNNVHSGFLDKSFGWQPSSLRSLSLGLGADMAPFPCPRSNSCLCDLGLGFPQSGPFPGMSRKAPAATAKELASS